jgi:hypothetical protein
MMVSKIFKILIYFLFVGLWFIALFSLAFAIIPTLVLVYFAGFLSNARPWNEMKHWVIWKWIREDFFCFKTHDEPCCSDHEKVIYAVYPHGHYSLTHLFYFVLNPRYEALRPAIHSFIFWIPFFATFAYWINAIDVTEESMRKTLQKNESIVMCPAGIKDMILKGTETVKEHRGFLRIAREANAKVIPVWCAQERSYYRHWLPFGHNVPIIFIWGRWWCPVIPLGVSDKSNIYFGKPMDPNDEEAFFEELRRIQTLLI